MAKDTYVDAITLVAEQVAQREKQTALPIDPFAIAKACEIDVLAREAGSGVSGFLLRVGDRVAIAYSTDIENDGFRRFSVSHELGHYFIDGHVDHLLAATGLHESRAGHVSRDRHEVEADRFAASLLMPRSLFKDAARRVPDGLAGIESLAATCQTSLTATAIRYAETAADEPFAVIVSKGEEVEFCTMSARLKTTKGIEWPKRGDSVPPRTAAWALLADPGRVLRAEREDAQPHLHTWFGGGPDRDVDEEAVGLGRTGRVLSVITMRDLPDDEDAEDEDGLIESWTPRFRGRR